MKRVFARIGMYLTVTDEEFKRLREEYYHEKDLSKEVCERFLKEGVIADTDSYIPDCVFEESEYYENIGG